jgi:nicotianamine synthase
MINIILQRKKDEILNIYEELLSAKNLKPSKNINATFSELVAIVQDTPIEHSRDILDNIEIRKIQDDLRRMSSRAESELELFWVKNVLKSQNAEKILKFFPYYSNYEKMSDLEIKSMQLCDVHKGHKALFVGSGPLPLSSIMMARKCGISIDNLDMDDESCKLSKELIKKIGLSNKIKTIKGNILDIQDLSNYQTIFIAALAGENDEEKVKIIDHIVARSKTDTHIVMRSVSGLGVLLYPEISSTHLKNIKVIRRSKSPRDIINNIIIGKIK